MREIKFRAWNDSSNSFYTDIKLLSTLAFFEGEGVVNVFDDNLIFEQYTGLKDKNGKEIYESDIIQFNFGEKSKEGIINSLVIFENGCFMYRTYPSKQVKVGKKWDQEHDYCNSRWYGPGNYPLCSGFYGHGDLNYYDNSQSKITVIGNIHENPELLS